MSQNDKVLIHEYFTVANSGNFDYLPPGETPAAGWAATGRAFLLYKESASNRVPVYRTMFESTYFVLTASATPTSLPGITQRPGLADPIGYVTTTSSSDVTQLYQHWDNQQAPNAFCYDDNATLANYGCNTAINNVSVYMPKVLEYSVTLDGTDVVISDEGGSVVTEIDVQPGDGNAILFRSPQAGLNFATLSIYCLDANGALTDYDGRFYVHKWSPREIVYIDDNRQTTSDKTYTFLVSMYDGTTFYNHDPKFVNRGSTGTH